MNKKLKGFSIAELLIALLIISIVLSAAIPTITKKMSSDRDSIWKWSRTNNSAFFGVGTNQTAIIGNTALPDFKLEDKKALSSSSDAALDDSGALESAISSGTTIGDVFFGNNSFGNSGDKLAIIKKGDQFNNDSNFMNSHISFYTADGALSATTVNYAGRLAMDPGNIALGMGSLQNYKAASPNNGENTAIGHFALLRDSSGYRNTAVGKKSLAYNETGSYNTALGFGSLFSLGGKADTLGRKRVALENTAVGTLSQQYMATGYNNTTVGSQALRKNETGFNNTAIGRGTFLGLTKGNNNTAIGTNACQNLTEGDGNICIGSYKGFNSAGTKDNYGLYIGSDIYKNDSGDYANEYSAPLIAGHTRRVKDATNNIDKEFIVNAKNIYFYPFNGNYGDAAKFKPTFFFGSYAGNKSDATNPGYKDGDFFYGQAIFNLRDSHGSDKSSIALTLQGEYNSSTTEKKVVLGTYSDGNTGNALLPDLSFNNLLKYQFFSAGTTNPITGENIPGKVVLLTNFPSSIVGSTNTTKVPIILNNKFSVDGNTTGPSMVLGQGGLSLFASDNSNFFNINKNSDYATITILNNNKIVAGSDSLAVSASDSVTISSSKIYLGSGLSVDTTDLKINSIAKNSGKVGQCINDIYGQLSGTTSDARLKNISGDNTAGLNEINKIQVKNFTYKNDKEKTPHVGVIAQHLIKIFPNSVFKDDKGYYKIKTEEIFYAMVNAIKELGTQVQDIAAKVTGLDKRITELEKQNKILKEQNKTIEKRLQKLESKYNN